MDKQSLCDWFVMFDLFSDGIGRLFNPRKIDPAECVLQGLEFGEMRLGIVPDDNGWQTFGLQSDEAKNKACKAGCNHT